MRKLLTVAAVAALITSNSAACTLFEGVYKAHDASAKAFPDQDFGFGMKLWPQNRTYFPNGHCILPDCPSDSMVTFDAGQVDSFPSPVNDDQIESPPPIITIKGEEYKFVCPSSTEPATM